jgi:hypothetical protein
MECVKIHLLGVSVYLDTSETTANIVSLSYSLVI